MIATSVTRESPVTTGHARSMILQSVPHEFVSSPTSFETKEDNGSLHKIPNKIVDGVRWHPAPSPGEIHYLLVSSKLNSLLPGWTSCLSSVFWLNLAGTFSGIWMEEPSG